MSKNTTDVNVEPAAVVPSEMESEEPTKKSFLSKLNPVPHVKRHPKIATAIGLGVAAVAGAALLGNDDSSEDTTHFTLEDDSVEIEVHDDGSFTVSSTDES